MVAVELPWPPSVNHYWRRSGRIIHISNEGRKYRSIVNVQLMAQGVTEPLSGELRMAIKLFPPDRRIRNIDNILKALLDAMQHGGAYHDDDQIKTLFMDNSNTVGGFVEIFLEPRAARNEPAFCQSQAD